MSKLAVASAFTLVIALAVPLSAQPGGGQGGGQGGAGRGGQGGGPGGGAGRGAENWERAAEEQIGWGEDGREERILPGQTTEEKAKNEWLDKAADKLELTDKKLRTAFKKIGRDAWVKCEGEDRRWAGEYKTMGTNKEKREEAIKKHKERLAKIWNASDQVMKKKEVLTEDQFETWKSETEDLRKETATDKSARQDEIRARKLKEIRDRAAGNADGEAKKEKEKKDEEDK